MRNLLLIHLESLNHNIYRLHPELFPTLRQWEEKSVSFSKFFTTATSTFMVISDILYGNMQQYEGCETLETELKEYPIKQSLLDEMKKSGYNAQAIFCPWNKEFDNSQKRHVAGFDVNMTKCEHHEEYLQRIECEIEKEEPFILLASNHISNLGYHKVLENGWAESGLERWERGYKFLDDYVKTLLGILVQSGKLENTTIIFYGDHGDDFYSHGNHGGLAHAIEPYAELIHVPMWVYDTRWDEKKVIDDIFDMTDLHQMIKELIFYPEKMMSFADLNVKKREYSVARSSYVAQPLREETFNKGYSVTDGKFFMLVTSKGLELYDIRMDEGCHNNLLNYFLYENEILTLNEEKNAGLKFHYRAMFNMNAIRQIRQVFYYYRCVLKREVSSLYKNARYEDKVHEMNFMEIHYT